MGGSLFWVEKITLVAAKAFLVTHNTSQQYWDQLMIVRYYTCLPTLSPLPKLRSKSNQQHLTATVLSRDTRYTNTSAASKRAGDIV